MPVKTGYSMASPILCAEDSSGEQRAIGEVRGSAFSIGGDYFLTAGHVARAAAACPGGAVAVVPDSRGDLRPARIVDSEILEGDVGLLRADVATIGSASMDSSGSFYCLQWQTKQLNPFEIVRVVGYAYGVHTVDERRSLVVRGFQGHVTSHLMEFKPVGWKGSPFPVYELSFVAPLGLSGAPLLNASGTVQVHGVVIGNSESRMLVHRSDERLTEEGAVSTLENYEVLTLGIAVDASYVLALRSNLLGKPIRDHLEAFNLVA
jgi:hypothetical protein